MVQVVGNSTLNRLELDQKPLTSIGSWRDLTKKSKIIYLWLMTNKQTTSLKDFPDIVSMTFNAALMSSTLLNL